ncbi:TonB-dependent receptor [Marinilongibacter aquaticus]|uniref:TonB-dependent receptor domain-containing protein n=1 Tax=Marinilongibacter aquaticus TaxID=2975157 RepID=UPI0021BD10BF|nr:TonB-dependent receptor [Marinilongibacter aquaticus]UBM58647.1 TonB-dependent receptor [Marinilongibacter aquaticus]
MSKYFNILFLLLLSLQTFGQITGRIVDFDKEPVPFASAVLYQLPDTVFVSGTTSAENGSFKWSEISVGNYFLRISSIGYRDRAFSLQFLPDSLLDLGEIQLQNENKILDEVRVSARRDIVEQTPFGKVINVQNSLITKGSNALQVLERLPGLSTDRRNGQFSLNGQSGVAVMINGRKVLMSQTELMALLESTLADNIQKVELITSPSAKYDAEGGAGIINIVMHEASQEKSRLEWTAMAGHGYGEKAALALNYQKVGQKMSLTSSYSYLRDTRRSGFEGLGTSQKPMVLGGKSSADFSTYAKERQNGHTLNLTAEYKPKPEFRLGTDWMLSYAQNKTLSHNNVAWDTEAFGYLSLKGLSNGHSTRTNLIGSVFMDKTWKKSQRLGMSLSLINYSSNSPTTIDSKYYDRNGEPAVSPSDIYTSGNRGESLSNIRVAVGKLDYEQAFGEAVKAEFGGKLSLSDNENDSSIESLLNGVWQKDARSQSLIFGKEKVLAAYSQFQFQMSEKASLHTGLRYEYWQREINTEKQPFRIAGFFPSLLYSRSVKEGVTLQMGYNRRISRPQYSDLVSNLFYNDPTFVFSGNPSLKPAINNQLKIELNTPYINSSLAFQHELHPILRHQITTNAEQNIGISSPQNLDYLKSLTFFLHAPLRLAKWWDLAISSTTSLRKYRVSYTPSPATKSYLFQGFNFVSSFKLPYAMELELSGWRNLPAYDGSNSVRGFGMVNLALAKTLRDKKGSFRLVLPDLLQSMKVHTHISGMTPIVFNINTVSDWRDETALYRVIRISFSRSFGDDVLSPKRNREEELKRLGQ